MVSEEVVEGLLARKLKELEVAVVPEEKPPNPAKTFFFSGTSSPPRGFRRRAFLITRPFISVSGAYATGGARQMNI